MARKVVWPLPPEQGARPLWYTLAPDAKIEELKERTDGQDTRLAHLESLLRICVKLFWMVLAAFLGVVVKEYVSSYQIVRSGQVISPPNSSAASLSVDRIPPPTPPKP
jgi:hypothetical protein